MKRFSVPLAWAAVALAAVLASTATPTQAAATRIAFVDAFATARGNAFTATADNPSAVFYNAAGLTQIEGSSVRANAYSIALDYEFEDGGRDAAMDNEFQTVPSAFFAHRFEDAPLAAGIGVYAPFALGSDWERQAPFADVAFEGDLRYVKTHPTLAWQMTDTFSVAVGPTFDHADLTLKNDNPALGGLKFEGNDRDVGFTVAARWAPNEHHAFGLNYQGRTTMNFSGTTTLGGAAQSGRAELEFPESVVFGYSWRPNERWNLEFNLDWTNWDRVNTVDLRNSAGPDLAFPLNWDSAFIWEFGATRHWPDGWHLSGGYTFVENAVPDADFIPIVPDSDRHFFALGLGREGERFAWQLTYQVAFANERDVSGSSFQATPPFPDAQVDGDYDLDSQALAASVEYRF